LPNNLDRATRMEVGVRSALIPASSAKAAGREGVDDELLEVSSALSGRWRAGRDNAVRG
jgi:hypothetical protein